MPDNKRTRLDSDNTKPSVTVPGDGPADTVDPAEFASSMPVMPGAEARKVGTVNAVMPLERPARAARSGKDRVETYEATAANGSVVTVTHNIETGESSTK